MSANNWRSCPECEIKPAPSVYGEVTEEEYLEAIKKKSVMTSDTFREDWEVYTNKLNSLIIYYEGTCEKCGFNHKFTHEESIL